MCFSYARWPHKQQSLFGRTGVLAHEPLREQLCLLQRMRVLRRPGLPISQVGDVTLKIAMLVTLWNSRALHDPRRALLHPAIAPHRHAARRAIPSRHQLPSRSPAKFTIFQRHNVLVRLGPGLIPALLLPNLCSGRSSDRRFPLRQTAYERQPHTASCLHWENCGRNYWLFSETEYLSLKTGNYRTIRGAARTIACRGGFSCVCEAATRDNSCCTTCANSPIWRSISIIFSRMFRIISMPARFTPMSRASVRITSSRSRSESVYSRVFPCERDGFSSPTRSYRRSVCGCSLYSSATALIM